MARKHVAIVSPTIAASLLSGRKRIESRFFKFRRSPFGELVAGDLIHFKIAGGDVIGICSARRVVDFADLRPAMIDALRREYGALIAAPPPYWRTRRTARYATLIWLSPLRPPDGPIAIPRQYGTGWVVLSPRTRCTAPPTRLGTCPPS